MRSSVFIFFAPSNPSSLRGGSLFLSLLHPSLTVRIRLEPAKKVDLTSSFSVSKRSPPFRTPRPSPPVVVFSTNPYPGRATTLFSFVRESRWRPPCSNPNLSRSLERKTSIKRWPAKRSRTWRRRRSSPTRLTPTLRVSLLTSALAARSSSRSSPLPRRLVSCSSGPSRASFSPFDDPLPMKSELNLFALPRFPPRQL